MKKLLFILTLVLFFILPACNTAERTVEEQFHLDLIRALANNNEQFQGLVAEGKLDILDRDIYDKLKSMDTTSVSFRSYQLLTFEDGKSVLIGIDKYGNDKWKISDIIFVPDEMNELFSELYGKESSISIPVPDGHR